MTWLYCRTTFVEDNVEKVLGEEIIKNADNVTIMDYGREEDWLYGFISEMDSEETNPVTIASGTAVQQFGRYNKDFNIGVDFGTFKDFYYDDSLVKPAGYQYNMDYLEKMIQNVKNRVIHYEKTNNVYSNFGVVYHSMTEIDELVN